MKALLVTTALAAVVFTGSPVMAQRMLDQESAGAAFAQDQPRLLRPAIQSRNPAAISRQTNPDGRRHSDNPANDVYDTNGNYIGSDPDVQIRNELMRDPPGRGD